MEKIIMSQKELRRLKVVNRVLEGELNQKEASELMEVSYRQAKRIVKTVKVGGDKAICHRGRGRPSNRKLKIETISSIISSYKKSYKGFGPTLAAEKLEEREHIKISAESLRKILIKHNLWAAKTKKLKEIHTWRERKAHCGELIQIDGSHHRWLEDRLDEEFCFMGYIDDATNEVYGKFYEYEGVIPILDSFNNFVKKYGIPKEVYVDKHSTYKTTRKMTTEEELLNEESKTQFERVMEEIGVKVHHAHSPQAKGRIERLFGTLQDRLVKEMRLAGIKTIEEANTFLKKYLPQYNKKFKKESRKPGKYYKKPEDDFNYKWIFAIQESRSIGNDYTIRLNNRRLQIKKPSIGMRRQRIKIKQAINGDLQIRFKDKVLEIEDITDKDVMLKKEAEKVIKIFEKKFKEKKKEKKEKKSWMDKFYIGYPKVARKRREEMKI